MKDLIEALTILAKYIPESERYPTICMHDVLIVLGAHSVSVPDKARLEKLGFDYGEVLGTDVCWHSTRFGSA